MDTTTSPATKQPAEQRERLSYSIHAELLGVDCFSVYRLVQRGKLRACRALRGKLLVPRTELLRLLNTEGGDTAMLKRNGQPCERSVPDYLGRLTDFEFLAYSAAFEPLANDYKRLSALHSDLTKLERSLPRMVGACAGPVKQLPELVPARDGTNWEVVDSLLKLERTAFLLCKREGQGGREFSVVERLDSNSPLAKAKGVWQVQMTGNDARLLLQDFISEERQILQLYASDVVATAREIIEEKYCGQNLGRVIKAISQRCMKAISGEEVIPIRHIKKKSEGVRV